MNRIRISSPSPHVIKIGIETPNGEEVAVLPIVGMSFRVDDSTGGRPVVILEIPKEVVRLDIKAAIEDCAIRIVE